MNLSTVNQEHAIDQSYHTIVANLSNGCPTYFGYKSEIFLWVYTKFNGVVPISREVAMGHRMCYMHPLLCLPLRVCVMLRYLIPTERCTLLCRLEHCSLAVIKYKIDHGTNESIRFFFNILSVFCHICDLAGRLLCLYICLPCYSRTAP